MTWRWTEYRRRASPLPVPGGPIGTSRRGRATRVPRLLAGVSLVVLASMAGLGGDQVAAGQAADGPEVVVATKRLEPFVFVDDGGTVRGYSIDLMDAVADRLDLTLRYVVHTKVGELIDAVAQERADMAIAGISMTAEREERIDFSHAYFDAGLQVMVRNEGAGAWQIIRSKLTSRGLLLPIGAFFALAIVAAHIVWIFERRVNEEHFPKPYLKGVWEGLWWSVVTVAKHGDGDKKLTGIGGRVIGLLWMVVGIIVIAYLTGTVTSALTVAELRSGIGGFSSLPGHSVLTVEGTVADDYLDEVSVDHSVVPTIEEAEQRLLDGKADALVYDTPVLQYFANTRAAGKVTLVGERAKLDRYAIVLPQGSPMREDVNDVLLEFSADGTLDALYRKWFRA